MGLSGVWRRFCTRRAGRLTVRLITRTVGKIFRHWDRKKIGGKNRTPQSENRAGKIWQHHWRCKAREIIARVHGKTLQQRIRGSSGGGVGDPLKEGARGCRHDRLITRGAVTIYLPLSDGELLCKPTRSRRSERAGFGSSKLY